jgi:hypothetical protein
MNKEGLPCPFRVGVCNRLLAPGRASELHKKLMYLGSITVDTQDIPYFLRNVLNEKCFTDQFIRNKIAWNLWMVA